MSRVTSAPGTGRGSIGWTCSPCRRIASRLVASTVTSGTPFEDLVDEGGAGVDQVLAVVEDQEHLAVSPGSRSAPGAGRPDPVPRDMRENPTAAATAPATTSGSDTGVRSAKKTPSGNCSSRPDAAVIASRVLPHPPIPVSVTRRSVSSRLRTAATSGCRPTKRVRSRRQVVPDRQAAQRGEVGAQVGVAELVHAFGAGDVSQAVQSQVGAHDLCRQAVQTVGGGLGAHDLVGVGRGAQTGAAVGRGPVVVARHAAGRHRCRGRRARAPPPRPAMARAAGHAAARPRRSPPRSHRRRPRRWSRPRPCSGSTRPRDRARSPR